MDYAKVSLEKHYEWKGKLEVVARAAVDNKEALSLAYTPGVAQPCLEIQKDVNKSYELTRRWNTVSDQKLVCQLWKENVYSSKHLEMLMQFHFVYAAKT